MKTKMKPMNISSTGKTADIGQYGNGRGDLALLDEEFYRDGLHTGDYLRLTINGRHYTNDRFFEAYADLVRP